MKTLYYNEIGNAISDYMVSKWLDNFLSGDASHVYFSSAIVLDELRARIKEGSIAHDAVCIDIDGKEFFIDSDGRSSDWDNCSELLVHERIMMRLF